MFTLNGIMDVGTPTTDNVHVSKSRNQTNKPSLTSTQQHNDRYSLMCLILS